MSENSLTILLLVSCILISGCVFTPSVRILSTNGAINQSTLNQSASGNVTPINPPIPGDFPVYISEKYINNGSGTIVMNYSEIVAHNYSDIPVSPFFANQTIEPFCGYSGNLSKISEIALNDYRVKQALKDGGIIEDIDEFVPYESVGSDICYHLYYGLRLEYKGQQMSVYVNESAMKVDLIGGWKENYNNISLVQVNEPTTYPY